MSTTAAHAFHLARLFTPIYATRVNARIVYPATATVVKPTDLVSALARPLHVMTYEPHRDAAFLATLAYGLIQGRHPFLDGNKRTAFFVMNEYLRAQGILGFSD
ncbi:hypothetical protein BDZ94DRAFT_1171105 [Collybia nuda]|uniref:Fido domain-containing protein n=1 Tax=Collybia nuda TaxID=64659 RepID=A0A9P5XXT0_9AGAR|nr:hypothetical protein BDZ94DRAFT_1171105 [Collybia nuda]